MKIEINHKGEEVIIRFVGKINMSQEVKLPKPAIGKLVEALSKEEDSSFESE